MDSTNLRRHAGDWTCPNCGARVFVRYMRCYKCQCPKPVHQPVPPAPVSTAAPVPVSTAPTTADPASIWVCQVGDCSAHNYQSRSACFRCHTPRGQTLPGPLEYWSCPHCLLNNLKHRNKCFRCQSDKPGLFSKRPGDWVCPQCSANVYSTRAACYRCFTMKPVEPYLPQQQPPQHQQQPPYPPPTYLPPPYLPPPHLPPPHYLSPYPPPPPQLQLVDWVCANCQFVCFAHRQTCAVCHARKSVKINGVIVYPPLL